MYTFGKEYFVKGEGGLQHEWLLSNIKGGYANMTLAGRANRMYSSYLTAAFHAPADRAVIMDGMDEFVGGISLSSANAAGFRYDTYPEYDYQTEDVIVEKRIILSHSENMVMLDYYVRNISSGPLSFKIQPHITFREPATVADKSDLIFDKKIIDSETVCLIPGNKTYEYEEHEIYLHVSGGLNADGKCGFYEEGSLPDCRCDTADDEAMRYVEGIHYIKDENTGFTGVGCSCIPCTFSAGLPAGEAMRFRLVCGACVKNAGFLGKIKDFIKTDPFLQEKEYINRRLSAAFSCVMKQHGNNEPDNTKLGLMFKRLVNAADKFVVERESTGLSTILAGFPWFLDWGRDTMIAFEGLVLTTGRFREAGEILESFAKYVKNGLLPNVFANHANEMPMYNTIDASLWYFHVVDRYLKYTGDNELVRNKLFPVMKEIIHSYMTGTDFGIGMDSDGLIYGGGGIDQITWMDVRIGDRVITPRHGCPVEINALWYNALCVTEKLALQYEGSGSAATFGKLAGKVKESFCREFYNPEKHCLYDVISKPGPDGRTKDASLRPNQLFAVLLPNTMLTPEIEHEIVDTVERELYTCFGIRSLAPGEEGYKGRYEGDLVSRDEAYHMGTVWSFLSGAFFEAYLKVNDYSEHAKEKVRNMLLCFEEHMAEGCLDGIAEVFDADAPKEGKGCYSQAWGVGELLRICALLIRENAD